MTKSKVFFLNARSTTEHESLSAHKPIMALKKAGLKKKQLDMKNVCIKTHFGALKNTRYLRPSYIRFLTDYVKKVGGYPVITESCGLGRPGTGGMYGGRTIEKEYLEVALKHGFTTETMGAPIYMLDGKFGTDYEVQPIEGKHFKDVLVAGRLRESNILISAAHFKGHIQTGFGGSIKNLGIGCVAKGAKGEAHTSKNMYIRNENINEENIKNCKKAVKKCPVKAMKFIEDESGVHVERDEKKCRRCRMCHSYCKDVFQSDSATPEKLCEHMADNALGVKKWFEERNGKNSMIYINYAIDIVQQCDCTAASDTPFVQDIGVLVSMDPVAVDQACVDLVHKSTPLPNSVLAGRNIPESNGKRELLSWIWPKLDENENETPNKCWEVQLEAAEKLGLGSRQYELIDLISEYEE